MHAPFKLGTAQHAIITVDVIYMHMCPAVLCEPHFDSSTAHAQSECVRQTNLGYVDPTTEKGKVE